MRIVFDDINNLERLKIFHKGVGINTNSNLDGSHQLQLRDGDVVSPNIKASEPLYEMCKHFLNCVHHRTSPRSSGSDGADIVKILEAIDRSIDDRGNTILIM